MDYQHIIDAVLKEQDNLNDIALKMYEHPETAYNEVKACAWLSEALEKYGFKVEMGLYGMPTAIRAEWGSGHPVIGLLAEYDALPGLPRLRTPLSTRQWKAAPDRAAATTCWVSAPWRLPSA